jgi:LPXTG-motif cell wall-anchored protein
MVTPATGATSQKSAIVAGIFGLLLGSFGVHRFYLGYTNVGLIYLGILLILGWIGIGFLIVGIWAIIEGIYLLTGRFNTDADGATLQR